MLNVIFTKNRAVRIKSGLFLILFLLIAGLAFLSAEPSGLKLLFSDSKTRFISQYGVTWIFDKEVEYGTFITGDYWVVGPVTIISVSPEPSYVSGNYINGSMINPPNGAQAYDSRAEDWKASFDNSLRVNFPATVGVNSSLVSTVSRTPYDATLRPTLQSAAVLTILSEAPPEGSFRPGLIGNSKVIYNVNDIDWSLLPKLKPTTSLPSSSEIASEYTRWLERPWLLHPTGWEHRFSMPAENSPSYHRDVALLLSQASILCLTDWGDRTELVTNFIQVAIDYYTMQQHGLGDWHRWCI